MGGFWIPTGMNRTEGTGSTHFTLYLQKNEHDFHLPWDGVRFYIQFFIVRCILIFENPSPQIPAKEIKKIPLFRTIEQKSNQKQIKSNVKSLSNSIISCLRLIEIRFKIRSPFLLKKKVVLSYTINLISFCYS